jgi:protein TonB
LRLIRSSGVSAFDDEALRAVRNAGRFPAAPQGLTDASYSFTLALTFRP